MTFRKRLSSKQREELFHRLDGQCHICQQTIQRNERWEVSHVIALEMGGLDDASNRAPAHYKCHKWQTHMVDIPAIAKAKRIVRRERDFTRSSRPLPFGRDDRFKKRMDGDVVLRSTGQPWRQDSDERNSRLSDCRYCVAIERHLALHIVLRNARSR